MTAYYWKSNKFKKLEAKWYKKLAKDGFEDIEEPNSPRQMLKRWETNYFKAVVQNKAKYEDKQNYYLWAGSVLHGHKFRNEKERDMWYMHTQGISCRTIAKKYKYHHSYVHKILKRIKAEARLKEY